MAALVLSGAALAAEAPRRVVSLNLCTDQLAMLVAAPGQLVAISALGADPRTSAMAEEARAYPVHSGQAEEVFALHPDLVLAGSYTARGAVDLLRRLGVRVVDLPPEQRLEDVAAHLREVGRLLGQEARAEALAARFEADLAALRALPPSGRRAALYGPNGYTSGTETLSGEILTAAGWRNVAADLGLRWGGNVPLERMVMAAPDLLISGDRYNGASQAEALLDHPALAAIPRAAIEGGDWTCGTPAVLRAIRRLREAAP